MPKTATADRVDCAALLEFRRPRHRAVLTTRRASGGVQLSPVTCGVDGEGRVVVSTDPQRAKVRNARRDPAVSLCVLSDDRDGPWRKDPPVRWPPAASHPSWLTRAHPCFGR